MGYDICVYALFMVVEFMLCAANVCTEAARQRETQLKKNIHTLGFAEEVIVLYTLQAFHEGCLARMEFDNRRYK